MKPWFVTIFSRHSFTIEELAAKAGVGESVIIAMLGGTVTRGVATHVLATFADLTNKDYSLESVEVALIDEGTSEVARLLAQIDSEYEAARSGVSGLAHGTSKHAFISKRMEMIDVYMMRLDLLVGQETTMKLISQMEQSGQSASVVAP